MKISLVDIIEDFASNQSIIMSAKLAMRAEHQRRTYVNSYALDYKPFQKFTECVYSTLKNMTKDVQFDDHSKLISFILEDIMFMEDHIDGCVSVTSNNDVVRKLTEFYMKWLDRVLLDDGALLKGIGRPLAKYLQSMLFIIAEFQDRTDSHDSLMSLSVMMDIDDHK